MEKVKTDRANKVKNKPNNKDNPNAEKNKGCVVIPYIAGVSEKISRIMKKHNISTAMKPHTTIKKMLVHPKDKQEKERTANCVYEIPCKSCPQTYIGETKRQFGVRMSEHKREAEKAGQLKYTRSKRTESLTEINKSAITDHVSRENHIIDWDSSSIIDREENRRARWVKEAIWIRKRGDKTMNRDEGTFFLSHFFDPLLKTTAGDRSTTSSGKPKHPVKMSL
ncbi:uncharacterized protein [Amphiura filiformis]|uniref:uncharacterized protein n=1 Tax=Amphiura filiformis TaxID=82378 RepID=UPI003B221CFD